MSSDLEFDGPEIALQIRNILLSFASAVTRKLGLVLFDYYSKIIDNQ